MRAANEERDLSYKECEGVQRAAGDADREQWVREEAELR